MSFDEEVAKLSEYAQKIMDISRTSASFKMKFLSNAITFLQLQESQYNLAVDGEFIYYNPLYVIEKYREDATYLDYAFLHMTVHCLFQHLFMRKQVDHQLWNAACDIYAFYIINSANDPKLLHSDAIRLAEEKDILAKACKDIKILTPEHLVVWLDEHPDIMEKIIRKSLFLVDSHDVWYEETSQSREGGQRSNKRKKKKKKNKNKNKEQDKTEQDQEQEQEPEQEENQDQEDEQDPDEQEQNEQNQNRKQKKSQKSEEDDDESDEDNSEDEDNGDGDENEDEEEEEGSDSDKKDKSSDKSNDSEDGSNESDDSEGDSDDSDEDSDEDEDDEDDDDDGDGDGDDEGDGDMPSNPSQTSRNDLAEKWKNMAQRAQTGLDTGFLKGDGVGNALEGLQQVNKENISYEDFLRKFSVLTEQIVVNMDEFDYCFYTYGLELYGNVPLIEPLEYKDTKRIHDFVIAIDTSGSTFGPLVKKFLSKTFNILSEQNSFDSRVCIHVIQCDTRVRSDVKIENLKDLEEYMRNFQIYGGGGTDFRPVFEYVNNLLEAKEFTDLRGLIYFTDGFGTFPRTPPQYETAFTFIGDDHCPLSAVPDWAITLELDKDEFKEVAK